MPEEFHGGVVYKELIDRISDLAYVCDDKGNITYANKSFERLSGASLDDYIDRPFAPLFDDKNLEIAIDAYTRTLAGEEPVYELTFKDTGVVCEYHNQPLRDESGRITGVFGTARDVTERSRWEARLKQSERRLVEAQRLANVGNWVRDIRTGVMEQSSEIFFMFGVPSDHFYKSLDPYAAFLDLVHPDDRDRVDAMLSGSVKSGEPFTMEFRIVRPDGSVRYILDRGEVASNSSGEPVRIYGSSQDITELKLVELQLRKERDKAQLYLDVAGVILLVVDADESVSLINRKGCDVLGYEDESEVVGLNWFDSFVPERIRDDLRANFRRLASGVGAQVGVYESPVVTSNGEERLVRWNHAVVTDPSGAFYATISSGTDLTELRRATEQLASYRSRAEALYRSVKDAIVTVDLDMRVVDVNDAAELICGISRSDVGRSFVECSQACLKGCLSILRETLNKGIPYEGRLLDCQTAGGRKSLSVSTYPLVDGSGNFAGAVLVVRDESRLVMLERDLGSRRGIHNITGDSERMQEVYSLIENLADIDTTVLVTGESGTGKELVAEALHYTGTRRDGPLVKVNCSALSEQLLESELFGHVKGAFTGAVSDRVGRFQLADGGTIFLDEIGDISPGMQLRLLRVLQYKEFERLGDSRTMKVDVRVIAATNRDLDELVASGTFRKDLYYRLKVVEICMPPLRDRIEDLPILEEYFLDKFNAKFTRNITGFSSEVQRMFMDYPWHGNVRELEHAIEHAFILCRGTTIEVGHLPASICRHSAEELRYRAAGELDERASIVSALERSGGNKSKAARMLGMSRRTIYRKIEGYGIDAES